jgi:TolB protein
MILLSLLAFILASCGEMDPEADPRLQLGNEPVGKILFVKDGDVHIWAGGDPQRLTEHGNVRSPAWGPDGERYLFVRVGDAYSDLYIGNANTGRAEPITSNEPPFTPGTEDYLSRVIWILDPVWSRTGTGIAYISDRVSDKNFVWYQSGPDGEPTRIHCSAIHNENAERPDFSPDGGKVVFAQRESGPADVMRWTDIRVCDLNSGEQRQLVEGEVGAGAYFPRWSPDGEWIAYIQRDDQGNNDLWVIPAEGGDAIRVTDLGDVTAPVWSPNGQHIAFFDWEGGADFRAVYVEFEIDGNGNPTFSEPSTLFNASGIDAPSGMTWTN